MKREKYLAKMMTRRQKEVYAQIVAEKKYVAKGNYITTCKVLMQLGLIKHNPDSDNVREYVLNGRPIDIPLAGKLPLAKDFINEIKMAAETCRKIIPFPSEPKMQRPPATYSNISREQHVEKWISTDVPATKGKRIGYNQNKKTA